MNTIYNGSRFPFDWLSEIIEGTLNPKTVDTAQIDEALLQQIELRLTTEIKNLLLQLRMSTWSLDSRDKIQVVLEQFDSEIIYLETIAAENLSNYPEQSPLQEIGKQIIDELEALQINIGKRYPAYVSRNTLPVGKKGYRISVAFYKILCTLSVDQIGLILKAADETKLIVSRSLSMVFKAIVPHLRTENKQELSWDSMRSSTYRPEENDKLTAVQALEKLISKIKGY